MKGKVSLWTKNRRGLGTNSGESGARNLEAESIRSRAENTGGCVNLKTVTDISVCLGAKYPYHKFTPIVKHH